MRLAEDNISDLQKQLDKLLNSATSASQSSADTVEQLKTLLDKQIAGFQQTRDALERALGPDGADLEGKDPAVDRLLAEMDAAIARQQILSERLGSIASDLRRGVTVDSDLRKNARQAISDAQKPICRKVRAG